MDNFVVEMFIVVEDIGLLGGIHDERIPSSRL